MGNRYNTAIKRNRKLANRQPINTLIWAVAALLYFMVAVINPQKAKLGATQTGILRFVTT